ncbi:MAG: hypothetical protein WA113_07220 [Desulfitobacteriaceae bacterium]
MKFLKQANPAQPRLVYIENSAENLSINGTIDFTSDGLGITPSSRWDSNMWWKRTVVVRPEIFLL